jgi:hypothetical protein
MAEVREIDHVALGKLRTALQGRKHGAIALAIATGVTDLELALGFAD